MVKLLANITVLILCICLTLTSNSNAQAPQAQHRQVEHRTSQDPNKGIIDQANTEKQTGDENESQRAIVAERVRARVREEALKANSPVKIWLCTALLCCKAISIALYSVGLGSLAINKFIERDKKVVLFSGILALLTISAMTLPLLGSYSMMGIGSGILFVVLFLAELLPVVWIKEKKTRNWFIASFCFFWISNVLLFFCPDE